VFQNRRKLKFFATALGFLFLLGTFLLSTHAHAISKDSKEEKECPVCQLAPGAFKVLPHKVVIEFDPQIVFSPLKIKESILVTPDILPTSHIRGPPLV
jgi:hypothetical protein